MKLYLDVLVAEDNSIRARGEDLPKLRPGSRATLVVEEEDVDDPQFLSRHQDAYTVEFDVSQGVAVHLKSANVEIGSMKRWPERDRPPVVPFAIINPAGPIIVGFRSGCRPRLKSVKVELPDLGVHALSLNSACTRLSEAFETDRISHTYNAFEVVYVQRNGNWYSLKELIGS